MSSHMGSGPPPCFRAPVVRFTNPITGETLIRRETPTGHDLISDIYRDQGGDHSHAVWENGRLVFVRQKGSPTISYFKPKDGSKDP